jgi:catechol 2,3-dioxygenase-like lactoylglutathione lyase family enzyme
MRIGLTGIFVDDQGRAERFYTEVLGFQVKDHLGAEAGRLCDG